MFCQIHLSLSDVSLTNNNDVLRSVFIFHVITTEQLFVSLADFELKVLLNLNNKL
jgi:hypothetical protein